MIPPLILITVFLISLWVIKLRTRQLDWKLAGRFAMSAMLLFTAIGHFLFTNGMAQMIPDFFPSRVLLVYLTGILEILFAIGLLLPRYQTIAGWVLIAFFITILPANIKAAVESINYQTGELDGNGLEYLWFRVPLQILFIVWVYYTAVKK